MKKIIGITIICFILAIAKSHGQQESYISINYAMSFATGELGDYISAASFRGAVFEYRMSVTDNILIGADVAWNVFYEKKSYDTYSSGTESLSGIQYRYQNAVPIMVTGEYLFMADNALKPYIGFGIGTMYSERSTEMGLYLIKENPWHFAIKPELGFFYGISYSSSIKISAKYYSGFSSGSLDNQGYFSICVGMAFNI